MSIILMFITFLDELVHFFTINKPKIVFCQSEKVEDIRKALEKLGSKTKLITFDKGDGDLDFSELLKLGEDPKDIAGFRYE